MEKITATDGKVFRLIGDTFIYGKEVTLGYIHYFNGQKLAEPRLVTRADFEEIDEPIREVLNG